MSRYFPGGPVAKTMLPLKGVQVRSLVEEYASWCGKKKKMSCWASRCHPILLHLLGESL